ncbi:alpha/beta fold hydrolase [Saccharopolyspora rectivirgula]|jgi:pimeloyl-ACP methyl ester carboxylesterase|uniref:Alpha/beta hydrolase n=1 Tax=Saccharopolyspora rectivirgula TaxID=28042 RepID=A0A073AUX0_9PSEU|nr:alpha/beta hydrolase [Saccharopolyspora rectivirgula]KEI43116.1 alpha/beta hydrolase [Saccharopolyspora rectivirgula]
MSAPPQGLVTDEIEFPAGKIRFYRAGTSGPAIVLLHGGGPDNALLSWRHAFPVLAADHQVFAPDLPGQGGSMPWRGRANQRTFEEVLRWLLDAWQLPAVTLVGMSMGGSIATGFTLRNPQRVNGLVLVNPTGVQARLPHHLLAYLTLRLRVFGPLAARLLRLHRFFARTAAERIFFAAPHQVPDLEDILQEMREEARARGSVFADWHHDAISRRSMRINHLPQLSQITCPTMVIHGDQDPIVPLSAAQQAAEAISGAQLRVVPGAGHWPHREKPTEFNALLREFVNSHR